MASAVLHFVAEDAGRAARADDAGAGLVAPLVVDVFKVEGVEMAGEVAMKSSVGSLKASEVGASDDSAG